MPSYPRITQVPQVFVPNQTFQEYIVITRNGVPVKVRPFRQPGVNGADLFGWEMEIDGVWTIATEKEFD